MGCTRSARPARITAARWPKGLRVGDEIRCPWHHACFSLRDGFARKAPAFARLPAWRVEIDGDTVFVREQPHAKRRTPQPRTPRARIVIIGGGAAGFAAAERLRDLGHAGSLTMLSADASAPYDRPNLSKDYLAGTAPEDWIPLQVGGALRQAQDRPARGHQGRRDRSRCARSRAARRRSLRVRRLADRHGRRAAAAAPAGIRPAERVLAALADGCARDHRRLRERAVRRVRRRRFHRHGGGGRIARTRARRARGRAGCGADGARARRGTRRVDPVAACRERRAIPPGREAGGVRRQGARRSRAGRASMPTW